MRKARLSLSLSSTEMSLIENLSADSGNWYKRQWIHGHSSKNSCKLKCSVGCITGSLGCAVTLYVKSYVCDTVVHTEY